MSSLFRTAFSDTHEPMFEKVGSVQERYMPGTYGAAVAPELELMVNGNGNGNGNGNEAGWGGGPRGGGL